MGSGEQLHAVCAGEGRTETIVENIGGKDVARFRPRAPQMAGEVLERADFVVVQGDTRNAVAQ